MGSEEHSDNAFTSFFLEFLTALDEERPWMAEAELFCPWYSEPDRMGGYALLRGEESLARGDRPVAVMRTRAEALLLAAVLPALGRDELYRLTAEPAKEGFVILGGLGEVVGHLHLHNPDIPKALHLAGCLVRSPEALATLLQAAGPTVLERVGRVLARRLNGGGPLSLNVKLDGS